MFDPNHIVGSNYTVRFSSLIAAKQRLGSATILSNRVC